MRKFYQNTPYFSEVGADLFAPLDISSAPPLPGPLFMDDYADDISTLGVVDVTGLATSGVIETEGDSDWFAVALTAGQNFEISYPDFESEGVFFEIYDAAGVEISETRSFTSYSDDYFGFTAAADANYYVAVTGFAPFTGINYSFYGAVYDDDFSADITTTALLISGGMMSGVLEAVTDVDWIGIDLTAGELFNVIISTGNMDPDIKLYTAAGELASGYSTTLTSDLTGTILSFTPAQSERYYISVQNGFDGFPSNSYTLSTFTDDFSADTSTTGIVTIDGNAVTINGEHEIESDVDWFAVTIEENQTIAINDQYEFDVTYYDATGAILNASRLDSGQGFVTSITAQNTGTYFVGVEGDIHVTQSYTLSGFLYLDDYSSDTSTSGMLEINSSASGELQSLIDSDWFAINLTEDERVTITSDLPDDIPLVLSLVDSNGFVVASDFYTGTPGEFLELSYDVRTAGTYFAVASFEYSSTTEQLSYNLSATSESIVPDIAGDVSTTAVLPLGGSVTSVFEFRYDEDWFAIEVGDNQSVSFTFEGDYTSALNFHDTNGNFIGSGMSAVFETAGTYYVEAQVGYYFSTEPYTITATANPDDIRADTTTDATITIGETVTSFIDDTSDADWYRITLSEGETVRFDAIYTDDSVGFPTIFIYGSTGSYVDGENGGLFFTAPSTGDFYIAAIGGANNGIQSYEMTAQTVSSDIGGDRSTLGVIMPGETIEGYIDQSYDADWFKFSYTAGETIRFDLDVLARQSLNLHVYDSDGIRLSVNFYENAGYFSGFESGDYFISVSSSYAVGQPKYLLSAALAEADIKGDVTTEASFIIGETVSSVINGYADRDWFRFEAELGQAVQFDMTTEAAYYDISMRIYDDGGNSISYGDYLSLTFVAETEGIYYLQVYSSSYELPEYEVTSFEIFDDYAGNTSTTGVIIAGETLSFSLEYNQDIDWFALGGTDGDVLRLSIENLDSSAEFSIVDENGVVVANNYYDSDLGQEVIDFAVSSETNYYLRVSPYQYGHDPDQIYTINAELINDDYIGSSLTLNSLVSGETNLISHDFYQDDDWLSYDAAEGQSLLFSYSFAEGEPNSYDGFAGIVEIINTSGAVVYSQTIGQETYNSAPINDFSFTFNSSETYFISSQMNGTEFGQSYSLTADIITVNGTDGVDTLIGSEIDDVIFGAFGNDVLIGGEGDDSLYGGEGVDQLIGGLGADVFNGGGGEDSAVYSTAESGAMVDLSTGLGGSGTSAEGDTYISIENIIGSAFDDYLIGDDERNDITAGNGNDYIFGGDGSIDYLYGNGGDDTIDGGNSLDYINGGAGADTLTGGEGGDLFDYNQFGEMNGDIIIDFALGTDRLDFTSFIYWEGVLPIYIGNAEFSGQRGEIRFEISGNDTLIQLDSDGDGTANEYLTLLNYTEELYYVGAGDIYGVSTINGDENNNSFYGSDLKELFYGLDGDDTIYARGGDDYVDAGAGDDRVYGGQGNDDLTGGDGVDYLYGEAGDDILRGEAGTNYLTDEEGQNVFLLSGGANIVVGNSQSIIDFSGASIGAVADLMMVVANSGAAAGDSYTGVDNITGSDYADRLFGDNDGNTLIGGDGNDALFGRNGDDIFVGGNGRDIFSGGGGFDTVDYSGEAGAITVDMMERIVASQAAEGDRLYSIESVIGTAFNDRIFGNNDGNLIEGEAGNDSLFGRNGDDVINGGEGDDLISAGAHDDVLNGGLGNDRLYTGAGADTVMIDTATVGNDTVYDFMTGLDVILIDDLSGNFDSFAELMASGTDDGTNVTFDFGGGNSLTIQGYNLADLTDSDFDFGDIPPSAELIDTELYASDEFMTLESFDWAAA